MEFDDAQPACRSAVHGWCTLQLAGGARNAGGLLRHFRFGTLADALDAVIERPRAQLELPPPSAERAKEAVA